MTDNEEGFTLIELILVTVISSIVMGAVGASLIVGLRTSDETQRRLAESHDAQITSAYFVNDVQSADYVSIDSLGCLLAGETGLIAFEWFDDGYVKTSAYFVHTQDGERRLSRRFCLNDVSTGASSIHSTLAIVHHLSSAAGNPSVTCDPACPATGTSTPTKVEISVTDESGYAYGLRGARRVA